MKLRHLAGVALILAVGGCGLLIPVPVSIHLYPLQGPLAEHKPVPVISATILGTTSTASLSVTLPGGETFVGPLAAVTPEEAANDDFAPVWDSVYGPGYYAAVALGSPAHARGVLKGNKGSTLFVETNRTSRAAPLEGVARDTNGNLFKVAA
jgi:hypothetical protein